VRDQRGGDAGSATVWVLTALLATLGGQTALNLAVALHDSGVLEKYGVELIGADIEAIQRGGAIALGLNTTTGGNPGTDLWAAFMRDMQSGEISSSDRDAHDPRWSSSEQTATEYGKSQAESTSLVAAPTAQTLRWYKFTNLFRGIMRNRKKIITTIRIIFPLWAFIAKDFIDWLTDIRSSTPTEIGCEIAWTLSALDGKDIGANLFDDYDILKAILPPLKKAWEDSK